MGCKLVQWGCIFLLPDGAQHHFLLSFRDMLLFHSVVDCPMNEITSVTKQKSVMLISVVLSSVLLPGNSLSYYKLYLYS
jgi:hypothetical protein